MVLFRIGGEPAVEPLPPGLIATDDDSIVTVRRRFQRLVLAQIGYATCGTAVPRLDVDGQPDFNATPMNPEAATRWSDLAEEDRLEQAREVLYFLLTLSPAFCNVSRPEREARVQHLLPASAPRNEC